jgi:hypothetical protein
MSAFEPQPWLHGALERLEARRGERLLVLLVDVPACLAALRRAIGSGGELLAIHDEADAVRAARAVPGVEVLAYEPQGSERFGTFDVVLAGPALALPNASERLAGLLRANLRPGGRFVLDLPGEHLAAELEAAWSAAGGGAAGAARLQGPQPQALAGTLRGAGLRDVEVAELASPVAFESPFALARMTAAALGEPALGEALQQRLQARFRTNAALEIVVRRTLAAGRR